MSYHRGLIKNISFETGVLIMTYERLFFYCAVIVVLLLIGMMGNLEYEDELAEQAFYEEMVCEGKWPDYKNLEVKCEAEREASWRGDEAEKPRRGHLESVHNLWGSL